jgi:hypothetical protein
LNKPQRQRTSIACIAAIEVFISYPKRSLEMSVATGTRHSLSGFGTDTFTADINIARTRLIVAAISTKLIRQKLHRQRFASLIIIKKGSQSPLQYFAGLLSLLEIKDLAQKLDEGSPTQTRVFRLEYPTMDCNIPFYATSSIRQRLHLTGKGWEEN